MYNFGKQVIIAVAALCCMIQSLSGGDITVVNSIKDLKDLSVATTDHGMLVQVKYYGDSNGNEIVVNGVPVNDEGGGLFKLDTQTSLSSVVIDDGINITANVSSGDGFWARQFTGHVNVCWFGAKANSSTADDSTYFQKGIDYIRGVNGGTSSPSLQHQGVGLYVPAGSYNIETTLDMTYSGTSSGLGTQYYGLSIFGADRTQSRLVGKTDGSPIIDLTGSPRGQIHNLYLDTSTSSYPSCAILTARNQNNGFAGGHTFEDITIFGYYTKYAVVMISSECNTFKEVTVNNFYDGAGCLFMGQMVPSGITSPYISTIGTVGGSTRNRFHNCDFLEHGSTSGNCLEFYDIDTTIFAGCYTKSKAGVAFLISGSTANLNISDIRDESEGSYFLKIAENITLDCLFITGRSSRGFRGDDGSVIKDSKINMGFIATTSGNAIDFYDMLNCNIIGFTTSVTARNSASGTEFKEPRAASAFNFSTLGDGAGTTGLKYTIGYSGGSANYKVHVMGKSFYDRHEFNNVIATSVINRTKYVWPDDVAQGVTANPFTPRFLDHGPVWVFKLDQNLTINNTVNINYTVDDLPEGMTLTMVFKQDSTGGRVVTFGSNYVLNGWLPVQTADAISVARFYVVIIDGATKFVKI